jgi:hypothetical protein
VNESTKGHHFDWNSRDDSGKTPLVGPFDRRLDHRDCEQSILGAIRPRCTSGDSLERPHGGELYHAKVLLDRSAVSCRRRNVAHLEECDHEDVKD